MVFENVVRGFSLVLHDPKGSHYKIWRRRILGMVKTNLNPNLEQNQVTKWTGMRVTLSPDAIGARNLILPEQAS